VVKSGRYSILAENWPMALDFLSQQDYNGHNSSIQVHF
jgi:hypothetical protein